MSTAAVTKVKFQKSANFAADMDAVINEFKRNKEWLKSGYRRIRVKAFIIDGWVAVSYLLLIFGGPWWLRPLFVAMLTAGLLGVAFCIGHDGGHKAFAPDKGKGKWLNRTMAFHYDVLLGVSSTGWDQEHNQDHHTYTNTELDNDIQQHPFARVSPTQELRSWHRWQHWYMPVLYGLTILSWIFVKDFKNARRRFFAPEKKPDKAGFVAFLVGKALFFSWTLALPIVLHPTWSVQAIVGTFVMVGLVISFTFMAVTQPAHVVDESEFTSVENADEQGKLPFAWRQWQWDSTCDYDPGSKLLCEALGGLNLQVWHHQAKGVPHVLLPDIAAEVKKRGILEKHSVKYRYFPTWWAGIKAHLHHVKVMGIQPTS